MQTTDIASLRKRARRSLLENGTLEIVIGIYLLAWGVVLIARTSFSVFMPFGLVLVPPALAAIQKRFVYPRAGYADFGSTTAPSRGLIARAAATISGALVAAAAVWIWRRGSAAGLLSLGVVPVLAGGLLAIPPLVFAFKYGVVRWYVIAALCVLCGFLVPRLVRGESYEDLVGIELQVLGGILLVWGAVLFIRFLRKYPVESAEVGDGGR